MKASIRNSAVFWLLVSPVLALLLFFFILPAFGALFYSMTDQKLAGQAIDGVSFIGFDNYARLVQDRNLPKVVLNSLAIAGSAIFLQQSLGLALAMLLVGRASWFRKLVHACVFSGWLMPEAAAAFVFSLLFSVDGSVNAALSLAGLKGAVWLIDRPLAIVAAALLWTGTASSLIVFEHALASLPESAADAARSDGASPVQVFFCVTFPSILPAVKRNSATLALNALGVFGLIYMLTGGGPLFKSANIPVLVFRTAVSGSDTGYGLALSFVLFMMGIALSLCNLAARGGDDL